ncbi:MAG: DUF5668 domain-containing protein [Chloroflexota bacterium]
MSSFEEHLEDKQSAATEMVPGSGESLEPTAPGLPIYDESPRGSHAVRRPRHGRPSIFWPLLLVGGGVMLLLSNLGYLPLQSWAIIVRLWPLLLVALGIDLLIGRRSAVGAVVSTLLILILIGGMALVGLFAEKIPVLESWVQPAGWHTEHVEYPLAGLESASVFIDWTSVPGSLSALSDSANLIEGDIDYRDELAWNVAVRGGHAEVVLDSHSSWVWFGPVFSGDRPDARWDVKLSPEIPLDLSLDAGSGPGEYDLSGLQISKLLLDDGSGPTTIVLPPDSTFHATIDGGSGPLSITFPESVGARLVIDSGSGPFSPDERFRLVEGDRRGDGTWETDNYGTAHHTIILEIAQGSGPITIQ